MKTTFDLPEPLLREVQELAKTRGTTAKSLVEQALIRLVHEHRLMEPYQLPDASVGGSGFQVEYAEGSWNRLRDAAYGITA